MAAKNILIYLLLQALMVTEVGGFGANTDPLHSAKVPRSVRLIYIIQVCVSMSVYLFYIYIYMEDGVSLFSQETNRTGENGPQFCQGRFRLALGKTFFIEGAVKHWLPRAMVKSPSPGGM